MRPKKLLCIAVTIMLYAGSLSAQGPEAIIPVPAEVTVLEGRYRFTNSPLIKTILADKGFTGPEEYCVTVSEKGIEICAMTQTGLFYGLQTVRHMTRDGEIKDIACCKIRDYPRFEYRGLHVDVSRHFRSIDFLKKQLDAMSFFKMNRMHLHLTDAAGWRLQTDAFPRLTQFAAWRPQKNWKDWWSSDRRYAEEGSAEAYGGYYTKEDIRDLIQYAAERHIEIIPEIEMPGHSEEVMAAYPELGCSGEPYRHGEFCIGKESTFNFLETVLSEVIDLFPSRYIHIGGDEAAKKDWMKCPDCQRRMKEEGLTDADQLQSYLMHRIGKFVNSKGRRIIGWDEILEGGLVPDVTVMSWRGTEGGVEAMTMGHDVIMTPGRYCYLDHAQDAPFKEPESIGGYLPLELAYGYDPVEESMPKEHITHLKGIQANLWAEYIAEDDHAEYMYWPRAAAIAETGWSLPENKDYADFRKRAISAMELMRSKGYKTFDLLNEYGERKPAQTILQHKGVGARVTYRTPANKAYPGAGDRTLTDARAGGWTYSDGRWQGFLSDVDVTVDLGSIQDISYVGGTFMQLTGPEVFMPEKVEISVSVDGQEFTRIGEIWNETSSRTEELTFRCFSTTCSETARYIRYQAIRNPKGGWLFIDEIIIN